MTIPSLSVMGLPTLAISEGASSPNPGGEGWCWSSLVARPMYWNGSIWTSVPTSGGGGGITYGQATAISLGAYL
jgi:hypothetical protein